MIESLTVKRTLAATAGLGILSVAGCGNTYPSVPSRSPQSVEATAGTSAGSNLYCADTEQNRAKPIRKTASGKIIALVESRCTAPAYQGAGIYKWTPNTKPAQTPSLGLGKLPNDTEVIVDCVIPNGEPIRNDMAVSSTEWDKIEAPSPTAWDGSRIPGIELAAQNGNVVIPDIHLGGLDTALLPVCAGAPKA